MSMELNEPPRTGYRVFEFVTSLSWSHDLHGVLRAEGKPTLDISSPPEFQGGTGVWTPEDLFVSSINACLMTTFLASAARKRVKVVSYTGSARGSLEHEEGVYRFTRILLTPRVIVEAGTNVKEVEHLIRDAHLRCFIARSVTTEVEVVPEISWAPAD